MPNKEDDVYSQRDSLLREIHTMCALNNQKLDGLSTSFKEHKDEDVTRFKEIENSVKELSNLKFKIIGGMAVVVVLVQFVSKVFFK